MDKKDAIVATAHGYSWNEFRNFANSITRSGFTGRRILFVRDITAISRAELIRLGFELIDYERREYNAVIQRFKLLADWLEKEKDNLRYVIQSDVRDVVFQSNPSTWLDAQTPKLFGASEFILYRNESTTANILWVEKIYGAGRVKELADEEVICAGTIVAPADVMYRLADAIYKKCTDRFGDDQAILNHLLRTDFRNEMRIPRAEEGFIMTAGWYLIGFEPDSHPDYTTGSRSELKKNPPVFRDGTVFTPDGKTPYCIVHQYERGSLNGWAKAITEKYRDAIQDTNPRAGQPDVWIKKSGAPRYSSDGLTVDWHDIWVRA